jgi:broad specificity phosphatase PhoE
MLKIFLIRHGETDYTAEKRYCGAIDAPLNKKGIRQAHQLKRLLGNKKIDVVYTSPLKRAVQTAEIIFRSRTVEICKSSLLRESHLGKWEGLTLNEIEKRFPADVKRWYQDPLNYGSTGGEPPVVLHRRVKRFLNGLLKRCENNGSIKTITIVTHSGPWRIIKGELTGKGLADFWKMEPKTGECKIVKV